MAAPAFAVFGGKTVGSGDVVANTLAAVLDQTGHGAQLCTATALGPRLMLTAAHCTEGGASGLKIIFATTLVDVPPALLRNVTAIAKRRTRRPMPRAAMAFNNPDDLALIVLDSPAPAGTTFATLTDGERHRARSASPATAPPPSFATAPRQQTRSASTARCALAGDCAGRKKAAVLVGDQFAGRRRLHRRFRRSRLHHFRQGRCASPAS